MIFPSEFLKYLYVFKVPFGGSVVTIPVPMSQGGTGADLTPSVGSLFYSTDTEGALLATSPNGMLVTDSMGFPSITNVLPAGLTIPDYLPLSGGTLTGSLFLAPGTPTTDTSAASKLYVDQSVAGLAPAGAVDAGSTVNFDATYSNGTGGIGATLVANSVGAVILDGETTIVGHDYLFKNQSNGYENGIYICTVAGDGSTEGAFERSSRYDSPSDINNTGIIPIIGGATQANTGWYEINTIVDIGVDDLTFIKFGNSGTVTSITAGANLTGGVITGVGTVALNPALTGITSITMSTGAGLRTGTTAANTALLQAFNTGSMTYTTLGTLTAGATPTFDLASSATIGGANFATISSGVNSNITSLAATNILNPGTSKFVATTAGHTGVTGNLTPYTIIFETLSGNTVGTEYSTGTGLATTSKAGWWMFNSGVIIQGIISANTSGTLYMQASSLTPQFAEGFSGNPFVVAPGGQLACSMSLFGYFPINATVKVVADVRGNATNNIDVSAGSYFSGCWMGG